MAFCIYDEFYIQYGLQIKSYYILNSHNQIKFYMQIRLVFPGPVTYIISQCLIKHEGLLMLIANNYPDLIIIIEMILKAQIK